MKTLHITIVALLSITLLSSSVVYANPDLIAQLEAKIAELEAKITELKEDKQNKNAKIAELRDKLKTKNSQAENQDVKLEAKLEKKNAKIAELEEIIDNKNAKIDHLKEKVDRKIDNKNEKVGALNEKMSDMKDEMRIWESTSDYRLFADGDIARHTYINENGTEVSKGWHDNGILGHHRHVDDNGNVDSKSWFDNEVLKRHQYVDENGNKVIKKWSSNGTLTYHNYIDENGNKDVKEWSSDGVLIYHSYIDENGNQIIKEWERYHNYPHYYKYPTTIWNGTAVQSYNVHNGLMYRYVDPDNGIKIKWNYYENGTKISEIHGERYASWVMGEVEKYWYVNGQMKEHYWNFNQTHRSHNNSQGWYESGQIKWIYQGSGYEYRELTKYYENGQKEYHEIFINQQSNSTWYYENGQISETRHHGDGYRGYYENGQIRIHEWWEVLDDGNYNSRLQTWDKDGNEIRNACVGSDFQDIPCKT